MSDPLPARTCAGIDASAVRWLWHPFLARGKLSVLDGDPGAGKSFLTVELAARLSRGDALPGGEPLDRPHTTVILNAEDDAADTVRPRAAAAGADLSRVVVAERDPLPRFPASGPALGSLVRANAADLLVIDPMAAFFPTEAWGNSDSRIRDALSPLAVLAAETGCAVLLVRHLTKAPGRSAVYRGGGGVGILGMARTGLLLARHPDDPDLRVLSVTKTNVGPVGRSVGFRLSGADGVARVEWAGPVDLSADELCSTRASAALRPRERAAEFLREVLANGPRPVSELEALAADRGLSLRTLHRAKEDVRAKSEQRRDGDRPVWYWSLPEPPRRSGGELPSLGSLDALARHLRRTKRTGEGVFPADEPGAD